MSHAAKPSAEKLAAVLGEVKGLSHPELVLVLAKALHPSWSLAAAEKARIPKPRLSRAKRRPGEMSEPPEWLLRITGSPEPEPVSVPEPGRPVDYAAETAVEQLARAYNMLTDRRPTISRTRVPREDKPWKDHYPSGGAFLTLMRAVQSLYGITDDWRTRGERIEKAYRFIGPVKAGF